MLSPGGGGSYCCDMRSGHDPLFSGKDRVRVYRAAPFQFGIRSLLIYTFVLAFMFGWMSRNLQRAARIRKAMGPRASLADCFFVGGNHWRELDFSGDDVTDSDLAFIEEAPEVRIVHLQSDNITDTGLAHLKNAKQLVSLDISGTKITDKGLEQLSGLDHLRELRLNNTQITAAGLKRLKRNGVNIVGDPSSGETIWDDLWNAIRWSD